MEKNSKTQKFFLFGTEGHFIAQYFSPRMPLRLVPEVLISEIKQKMPWLEGKIVTV